MMRELLRAEDLQLEREGAGRLNHMDLSVTAGSSMGIIGLSGGGKTALAEVLCGERAPDRGAVWHGAQPAGRELLSRMGMRISRDSALLKNLPVAENLLVLGRPVGEHKVFCRSRKIVRLCRELLAAFGMEEWLDVPPEAIPVAVQHRLLLIGAVVRGKDLVALDHVADTYTLQEQTLLADCIQRLCGRGVTVLYLTGHIDQVLWRLDRITVVRDGRRIKELCQGQYSEAALRTYVYGYRASQTPENGGRNGGETVFAMDGVPIRERSLIPILDADGSTGAFLERLGQAGPYSATVLSADSLSDRWVGSMSTIDNLLLPLSRRLSGPLFYISGPARRLLRMECTELTGLSADQLDQPFSQLSRMERFRLLLYREGLNRPPIYVFDRITAGADLQDREEMRRLAGALPGIIFYISGDYGELTAFETRVLTLTNGHLEEVAS